MSDPIDEIADVLRYEHGTSVDVQDQAIRLLDPVRGDPGLAVLKVLALAQAASPVGAAAHGPSAVAAGVWRAPDLYVARWTMGRRWVAGYHLTGGSSLRDYIGMEGRVPTRFEVGNWYGPVPDAITEAFLDGGILIDDPPFPVAARAPERPPAAAAQPGRGPANRAVPAAKAPRAARALKPQAGADRRLCPECRMHKAMTQFVAGSDLCVDCR